MREKIKIVSTVGMVVLILDQWTKSALVDKLQFGEKITIFENFFDIVHARNRGAAFGFLSAWDSEFRDIFFYVLSVAALIFLYFFLKQIPDQKKWWAFPVGLIFGGALGNIYDRVARGSVVDFLSIHWNHYFTWPAFNIADSAITIGVIFLIYFMSFIQDKPKKSE